MNFITSIIHAVYDRDQAAHFFINILGFNESGRDDNHIQVENGAVSIRLISTGALKTIPQNLELEITTLNLEQAQSQYLTQEGINLLAEKKQTSFDRIETKLQAPHGVILTLSQTFDEDELNILLPLPTRLDWDPDTEKMIQRLLRIVPISFRTQARLRVTEKIELLAIENGEVTVDQPTALRGIIEATPAFQHEALKEALMSEGIDPDLSSAAFDP